MTCTCKELKEGGNICHSNAACECQMFGGFDDPTFCMEDELKEMSMTQQQPHSTAGEQQKREG